MSYYRRSFALSILFLLIFSSCKTTDKEEERIYRLSSQYVLEYQNFYTEKGKLDKRLVKSTTTSPDFGGQELVDFSGEVYFYDELDSLAKFERYRIDETNQNLESVATFTKGKNQTIYYNNYPDDTISYSFQIKDINGNVIEEYSKVRLYNLEKGKNDIRESKWVSTYNQENKVISSIDNNITESTETIRKYEYKTNHDTAYTYLYENDDLVQTSKKFNTPEGRLEISECSQPYSIDSTFYINNKPVKSINYDDFNKRTTEVKYDKHGNEVIIINQTWNRVK